MLDHLPRRNEGSAIELLRVQVIFDLLRHVSPAWKYIGNSLRTEPVPKARLVTMRVGGSWLCDEGRGGSGALHRDDVSWQGNLL
jgi:hypothetical protein